MSFNFLTCALRQDVKDLHEEVDRSASQKESDIYQSIVEDECRRYN